MAWDRCKSAYLGWVEGDARGGFAPILRASLTAMSATWLAAVKARQYLYRAGALRRVRLPGRVVSVGNLTLGGTGKTPMVEWIARWLLDRDVPTAVLTRGYGAPRGGAPDDEAPTDLAAPGRFWRLAGANRVASGRRAFAELGARVALLDDGFQHLRLARDLDVVLVDATRPFGNGHLFPRGTLREPVHALGRADLVVLTHADLVPEAERAGLRARLADLAGSAPVLAATHRPIGLRALDGRELGGCDRLAGQRVFACSGIGNPVAFTRMLERLGAVVAGAAAFPDHHAYTAEDIASVAAEARRTGADVVAMTEKDRGKFAAARPDRPDAPGPAFLSVAVRIAFPDGAGPLTERLERLTAAGGAP